ncbi:lipid-A-disaccharide synthase [Parelusimicrobium proximum]|uniref:lipid-A-disaccharide synthase n=1 Tax=Parelusimicrobium proximum TaxID=3228953 RepID=UPI003D162A72
MGKPKLTDKILIVAGDVSGDVHASKFLREIKKKHPAVKITSIGGQRMKAVSNTFICDLAGMGIGGFVEPILKIPFLWSLRRKIAKYLDTERPDCVVLVDYYGFNSGIMKMCYKRNIPVYYFIAPQMWASRSYRAKNLAKMCKEIFVIYPFETEFHKKYGGNAVFLGNPLMDTVPQFHKHKDYSTTSVLKWKIGFLPGSRPHEIKSLVPVFYKTFKELEKKIPSLQAYLFAVPETETETYQALLGEEGAKEVRIIREDDYKFRSQMDFLFTCSGTATLENAILGVPQFVAYKLSYLTYHIAKMIIKVPFISLVNILAGKKVVNEYIQNDMDPEDMAEATARIMDNEEELETIQAEYDKIRMSLGEPGFAERAAHEVIRQIYK